MSAKLDVSPLTILVWCNQCPSFSQLADSILEGHELAVAHEKKIHPGSRDAASNLSNYVKRESKKLVDNNS